MTKNARTSKLCHNSLALESEEQYNDWEDGLRRSGRGKQKPEYITTGSMSWERIDSAYKWLSGCGVLLLIHRILTIFCHLPALVSGIGEVGAILPEHPPTLLSRFGPPPLANLGNPDLLPLFSSLARMLQY
jgi:hypothetical protein